MEKRMEKKKFKGFDTNDWSVEAASGLLSMRQHVSSGG